VVEKRHSNLSNVQTESRASRHEKPACTHLAQAGVVGQFDCGRMTGLNGSASGTYLENNPDLSASLKIRIAGMRPAAN
jgi:hypothetical protein